MNTTEITNCPSTLAQGFETYSPTALKKLFGGKKVYHILAYTSPTNNTENKSIFENNQRRISISGVQEKFLLRLEKNKLRLINEGEQGTYILKPIPSQGKNKEQMPANEQLTMQIAKQIYDIETAENGLVFFESGEPAYIAKRFDINKDGTKLAQEDFASLAARTNQTHGENYKYLGNYLQMFDLMAAKVPAYATEAPKLFKIIVFNYLFSNGDAHFKNFSLLETPQGDYRLSPAYDLLNTQIHIEDTYFALSDGLLPKNLAQAKIATQFETLAIQAKIPPLIFEKIMTLMLSKADAVQKMISASFLKESIKKSYLQAYQTRLKKVQKSKI